jgi:hypothetical protein
MARLKSCPDTKPSLFAVRKADPSIEIHASAKQAPKIRRCE